jgi:hypothetical protein
MTYQVMVFFFPTWDLHVQMNIINFMPMIILIILIFSNLAALAFDQRCICDGFGTSINQFCCDQCFGFKGSSRIFSFQLMQKVALFCGITH